MKVEQKKKRNINVMRAALLCRTEAFQTFLRMKYTQIWDGALGTGTEQAAFAMRNILGINSRKELETNKNALRLFDRLVAEFLMWKKGK